MLGENFFRDISGDVRQTEVSPGIAVGQLFVIEAHQREQRRVKVSRVHAAFHGFQAEFIRGPKAEAFLNTGTGQPHWVSGDVVIATIGT